MTITDFLAIIALFLNIITMIIVIRQTILTHKSFDVAKQAFESDIKLRELSMITKSHFVIHVNIKLEQWLSIAKSLEEELEIALKDENLDALIEIKSKYYRKPDGVMEEFFYEKSPEWLAEIYYSSAQNYYYIIASLNAFKSENDKIVISCAEDTLERIMESRKNITYMKKYIENCLPMSYLNTPEMFSVRNFF